MTRVRVTAGAVLGGYVYVKDLDTFKIFQRLDKPEDGVSLYYGSESTPGRIHLGCPTAEKQVRRPENRSRRSINKQQLTNKNRICGIGKKFFARGRVA